MGESDVTAGVTVNGLVAARQDKRFVGNVPVSNSAVPVWQSVEVKAYKAGTPPASDVRRTLPASGEANHVFVPKTPEAFEYDDDGNLTKDGRWIYSWDGENRLVAMETRPEAVAAGVPGRKLEFAYDWQGRRIRKRVFDTSAGGVAPQATFVRTDTTTKGNWKGTYGEDGYQIVSDSTSYPSYAQVQVTGAASWTWDAAPVDTRGLERAMTGRIAATWYSATQFTIDINLTDGKHHEVALYCVDWDSYGPRSQHVFVRDAVTNQQLDSKQVQSFVGGQYWIWRLRGHVKLEIVNNGIGNAVAVGLVL
jgi:hypothetical protein